MKNLDEIQFEPQKRTRAGMTVPEGFFEQFQKQMEAKIDTLEAVKQMPVVEMPVRRAWKLPKWSVAAAIALLMGVGFVAYSLVFDTMPADEASSTIAQAEAGEEEYSMEDMVMRSVNDYELYELYCDL